jgi:hypothetical protein
MRLSIVSAGAFWWCDGTDLSAYVSTSSRSYLIGLYDSTGKSVLAYTGAVGAGEAAGAEKFSDTGFASAAAWTAQTGWSVNEGTTKGVKVAGAGATFLYQTLAGISSGMLLKYSLDVDSLTAGGIGVAGGQSRQATIATTAGVGKTVYVTAQAVATAFGYDGNGYNTTAATVDNASLTQITAAAATGFALRNAAKLGGAQSILKEDSGFARNDASGYTYKIYDVGG